MKWGFQWKRAIQQLSGKGGRLKQTLRTQRQRGAPVLFENSPCSSAVLLSERILNAVAERYRIGNQGSWHQRARIQFKKKKKLF